MASPGHHATATPSTRSHESLRVDGVRAAQVPRGPPGQGPRVLPEAAQVLGPQRIAQEEAEGAESEAFISVPKSDKILPIHRIGLGRGRAAGVLRRPTRVHER